MKLDEGKLDIFLCLMSHTDPPSHYPFTLTRSAHDQSPLVTVLWAEPQRDLEPGPLEFPCPFSCPWKLKPQSWGEFCEKARGPGETRLRLTGLAQTSGTCSSHFSRCWSTAFTYSLFPICCFSPKLEPPLLKGRYLNTYWPSMLCQARCHYYHYLTDEENESQRQSS